jgi:nucleotide-binding universal stress UspA family protein
MSAAQRFLVGIDGSREADRALAFAVDLTRLAAADLYLVHARTLPGANPALAMSATLDALEERAREAASVVLGRKLEANHVIARSGPAVEVLLMVAEELGAALIVVGTAGEGHSVRGVLGSTAAQLVVRSRIPVVVVP